ncbi:GTPase IMAP family member 9-like [Pseudoliparis swirei]|uniref:GTPase IMAP family member 9-like n=1 Tax=Pseudoliparis swirei TaxID=2059687 RepID=UPI0024BD6E61|nr:GTPase IMAP family member 9-like [Pseudoliparis swirei]
MDISNNRRIAILGKTGVGKSSLANTIFEEQRFKVGHNVNSETTKCQAETKGASGGPITLIDTPGFFDTDRSEDELKPEILRCITEFSPGPHAFLIVLRVERFTEQEQAVVNKVSQYFSEEVFQFSTVLFTHGDQLPDGDTIGSFVRANEPVRELVEKCGGRCHVIDSKYWNNDPQEEYRNNRVRVTEILKTINQMIEENQGRCYTNEMLQAVERRITQEVESIRRTPGNKTEGEMRREAKENVFMWLWSNLKDMASNALWGALFGLRGLVTQVITALAQTGTAGGRGGVSLQRAAGVALGGAMQGVMRGLNASEGADSQGGAGRNASGAYM